MTGGHRILILGGYGYTGKLLSKHLLAHSDAKLIIGGRHLDKANEFAEELGGDSRISTVQVDASDAKSLASALQNDVDILVVAAPTSQYAETVARAALDARVDCLDVQLSSEKLAALQKLKPEIEKAGLCFVTEAGSHPGLPSAMVRYASTKMDSLESALVSGYMNMEDLPNSEAVDELMQSFSDYQCQVFRDGKWTKPQQMQMRKFDFGDDVGNRTCFSWFLEEMRALPEMIPSLQETGFYMSGLGWFMDYILFPFIVLGLLIAPKRGIKPLGKLLWWGWQHSPPPYTCVIQLEATGLNKGRKVNIATRIEHKDGYELTAIPVVAYLMQYLDGTGRQPGLHMMGHLAEPARLYDDMQCMGIQITHETGGRVQD